MHETPKASTLECFKEPAQCYVLVAFHLAQNITFMNAPMY